MTKKNNQQFNALLSQESIRIFPDCIMKAHDLFRLYIEKCP